MSRAAQKTAAKVQLMKLKQKSVGASSVPMDERLYLNVETPGGKFVGCWVSCTWSLGKVVDTLADLSHTVNNNNVAGQKRLWLFKASDGQVLNEDPEVVVGDVVKEEVLYNGDSVVLGYVERNPEL